MFKSLSPGAIGVKVENLEQGLELAARHGFAGYHFNIAEANALGVAQTQDLAAAKGVRLSAWSFPLDFRSAAQEYQESLAALPQLARTAEELGVLRTATWISPASDDLSYEENFDFHVQQLKPAAAVLADCGIRLGLEYLGPKTLRAGKKHSFAHTMEQMGELCAAIGDNVGFLLDSWHWYTAHETADQLRQLKVEQAVDVHVNDAPADVPIDEQIDHVRTLPGATGVVDIVTFLTVLQELGYDGPVMVEPFNEALRQMAADEACAATAAALDKVWVQAGLC